MSNHNARRIVASVLAIVSIAGLASVDTMAAHAVMRPMSVPAGSDPKANVPVPSTYGANCVSSPYSTACYSVLESMLNSGRAAVGKPKYNFFTNFTHLTSREQILVLLNQDRASYGVAAVAGMNATLQGAANTGAANRSDPNPVSSIGGYAWRAYGSNVFTVYVAGQNPLFAYFQWMYADGPGSGGSNVECRGTTPTNCWIHRHNNLTIFPSGTIAVVGIGLAAGTVKIGTSTYSTSSVSQLFEAFTNTSAIPTIPTITAITPTSGPHAGGTGMTVSGYGFRSVKLISICGVAATSIVVRSLSSITLKTGRASSAMACNVGIKTSGGSSVSTAVNYYKYT